MRDIGSNRLALYVKAEHILKQYLDSIPQRAGTDNVLFDSHGVEFLTDEEADKGFDMHKLVSNLDAIMVMVGKKGVCWVQACPGGVKGGVCCEGCRLQHPCLRISVQRAHKLVDLVFTDPQPRALCSRGPL